MTVTHLIVGPEPHGVVRFGCMLHRKMRSLGLDVRLLRSSEITELASLPAAGALHLQFTDHLFGTTPESAAATVAALAGERRHRLTATLHDIPQSSDGQNVARRTAAYAVVAAACDGIVVSSLHELKLLRDNGINTGRAHVIPLPVEPRAEFRARQSSRRTVGVFGFIYPGKGHAEVIRAAATLPSDVEIHAVGENSRGHDDLVLTLRSVAKRHGRRFHVTGHVCESRLMHDLQQVTVPVVAHQHMSASGSMNSWLAAARRPLAPRNRYTAEFYDRNPGSLILYADTPDGLRRALRQSLDAPEMTWLSADSALRPTPTDVGRAYNRFFTLWR